MVVKLCLWPTWRTKALGKCVLGSICHPCERSDFFLPYTTWKSSEPICAWCHYQSPQLQGSLATTKGLFANHWNSKDLKGLEEALWRSCGWNETPFSGGEPVSHWSLNLEILAFFPWEMRCWNQIAEAVLHEWELKKRLKKFKAKFRYIFTIFPSTLTQRIKYSLTEKWKNDFNRIWSEFCNSRIVIYSPESRIVSHKNWEVIEVVMTFRKISIYFDLREGGKEK